MTIQFKKAERKRVKLRLAVTGVGGSGKTYSALLLASGLGEKIAVIDSERESAELYDDLVNFDVFSLSPPHSPRNYIEAIDAAVAAKYDVLIVDSLSAAWNGEGGVLEMVDSLTQASTSKNSYMSWNKGTKEHNLLINKILNCPLHIICTLRSKTAYELIETGKGGKAPKKIGLAPIQRDGIDYEFSIVMDIAREGHLTTVSKDRTGQFIEREPFLITKQTGIEMKEWLLSGKEVPLLATIEQLQIIHQVLLGIGLKTPEKMLETVRNIIGRPINNSKELSHSEAILIIENLETKN